MDALFQFGIRITLALQTLSPALDGFMEAASFLGRIEFFLVLIPFIYWTVDRRIGVRTLLILIYADFVTASFKLFLHQPRPYWLGGVKELSTEVNYALPSSHASSSASVGGYFITRSKENWLRILIGAIILLIGISRLYLGVHYPHDVLFGWLVGFAVLWGITKWNERVSDWLKSKSLAFQIGLGFIDSILIFLIGLLIRFTISGTPDPASYSSFSADARSVTHFFTLGGALFGTTTGYALMRQYARFGATGTWGIRLVRYAVGIIGLLALFYGLDTLFASIAPDETGLGYALRYIRYSIATLWATFLAPWLFLKLKLAESGDK
jgi:membrane-associated phospholipid phosphatase